jgi:hypothetical protein
LISDHLTRLASSNSAPHRVKLTLTRLQRSNLIFTFNNARELIEDQLVVALTMAVKAGITKLRLNATAAQMGEPQLAVLLPDDFEGNVPATTVCRGISRLACRLDYAHETSLTDQQICLGLHELFLLLGPFTQILSQQNFTWHD